MQRMTMNVPELAKEMGISLPVAYELVKQEGFPALHVGRRIVVPVAAFQRWLEENSTGANKIPVGR